MEEDAVTLGGNIKLIGFKDQDGSTMVIVRKVVGNYARKFSDSSKTFESLAVHLKPVHERETSEKSEIDVRVIDGGKSYNAEVTERNLFFALDSAMKKVQTELAKNFNY
jgi:ribosome-associated translation inhibitor RaiA